MKKKLTLEKQKQRIGRTGLCCAIDPTASFK
jgi:hypothetical protein